MVIKEEFGAQDVIRLFRSVNKMKFSSILLLVVLVAIGQAWPVKNPVCRLDMNYCVSVCMHACVSVRVFVCVG